MRFFGWMPLTMTTGYCTNFKDHLWTNTNYIIVCPWNIQQNSWLEWYLTFFVNPLFRMWQCHGFTPPYSPSKLGRFLPRLLLDTVTHQYSLYLDSHAGGMPKKGAHVYPFFAMFQGTAVVSIFSTTSSGASSKRVPGSRKISEIFVEIRDPQVTMGFNTKSWSNFWMFWGYPPWPSMT